MFQGDSHQIEGTFQGTFQTSFEKCHEEHCAVHVMFSFMPYFSVWNHQKALFQKSPDAGM